MNERIKALVLNERNMFVNGVTESDNKIYIHGSEENLAKFAELIVQECVAVCWAENGPESGTDAGWYLKEHFGVEE